MHRRKQTPAHAPKPTKRLLPVALRPKAASRHAMSLRSTLALKRTSLPPPQPALAPSGTRLRKRRAEDTNEQGASQSPDTMSKEPNDINPTAPDETIEDDDDLSEEYDDAVRQMPEPDSDWKREWLDANKDKLLSVLREEERILATGTPT